MKKMFVGLLTGLFLIFGILTMSSANTIVVTGSIDSKKEVDHWDFSLFQETTITFDILANEGTFIGGVVDFFGNGAGNDLLDTSIWVFKSDGEYMGTNDDINHSGGSLGNDGSLFGYDSFLTLTLAAGDYLFAIGDYDLSQTDAWAGINESTFTAYYVSHNETISVINHFGMYQITFDADADGLTVSTGGAPVPEPATMLLFGLGLLGLAGVNRRKK